MDTLALRTGLSRAEGAAHVWAAVAVVLAEGPDGLSVLLIRRASREDDPWSGQIACPGGRVEPGDASPLDACIREAREEVGLDLRHRGELLGMLPSRAPANKPGVEVAPFVWLLRAEEPVRPGSEVVAAWYQPLSGLRSVDREVRVSIRGRTLRTRAFVAGDAVIWGFTYRVLVDLLERLGA